MERNSTFVENSPNDRIKDLDIKDVRQNDRNEESNSTKIFNKNEHISPMPKKNDIPNKEKSISTHLDESTMDENLRDTDSLLTWTSIRPWVAQNISCWDILCDKAKWTTYNSPSTANNYNSQNLHAYKIQVNKISMHNAQKWSERNKSLFILFVKIS